MTTTKGTEPNRKTSTWHPGAQVLDPERTLQHNGQDGHTTFFNTTQITQMFEYKIMGEQPFGMCVLQYVCHHYY